MSNIECPTCRNNVFWYPAINEAGWKCCGCGYRPGEPAGFDPQRDRDDIYGKCFAILTDLADSNLLSVSNGSMAESMALSAARKCREAGLYDQTTIIRLLAEINSSHADYWRDVSEGILAGRDPRARCDADGCSRLACSCTWRDTVPVRRCREHSVVWP